MFGNKFEAAYAVSCFFKLIGDIIFVIGEFIAEIFTNFNYFFIVIYNADFSENNYTVYIERPFAVFFSRVTDTQTEIGRASCRERV